MSLLEELKQYRKSRTLESPQPGEPEGVRELERADELNETNEESPQATSVVPSQMARGDESNESNEAIRDSAPVEEEQLPAACRGCAAGIPEGTTLCQECSAASSPLVQNAVELSELAQEASLRGRALVALDRKRYPRVQLTKARSVGPGLISWCPVLRAADGRTLRMIIELAESARTRQDDD